MYKRMQRNVFVVDEGELGIRARLQSRNQSNTLSVYSDRDVHEALDINFFFLLSFNGKIRSERYLRQLRENIFYLTTLKLLLLQSRRYIGSIEIFFLAGNVRRRYARHKLCDDVQM